MVDGPEQRTADLVVTTQQPNPTPWSRILQGTGLPGRAGEAMVLLVALLASPLLVAGLSLPLGAGGGLYWLVPGVLFCLVVAVLDAGVLLIEICGESGLARSAGVTTPAITLANRQIRSLVLYVDRRLRHATVDTPGMQSPLRSNAALRWPGRLGRSSPAGSPRR